MELFIDLETTGLTFETAQIVELAIVDINGRCLLSTRYGLDNTLKLQTATEIDKALEYNKLTRDELELYPPMGLNALALVHEILKSGSLVVGHNISYDMGILTATSTRLFGSDIFRDLKTYCTMGYYAKSLGIKSGRKKLPNLQLDSVPHSALSDVQNCRLLYQQLNPPSVNNSWNF
jgi:DNA polymerase III epsilon subunit-like protein